MSENGLVDCVGQLLDPDILKQGRNLQLGDQELTGCCLKLSGLPIEEVLNMIL